MPTTFVARGADAYEAYMGRWSRRLAPLFLDFAGLAADERVVDIGCGTGSLTFAIVERADVRAIEAIDFELAFIEALQARSNDPRITAHQGDACALPFANAAFDRALALLVLHFVSDPSAAVAEMRRIVRPGGVAAAVVWDTFGGMPSQRMFWDTLTALEPSAAPRRAASYFRPTTGAGELRGLFEQGGFTDITEAMLTIRMEFVDFADYWRPLLTGQGTTAEYLEGLPGQTRQLVESAVRAAYLCERPDGPRSFASSAWAVRGTAHQF